MRVGFWPLMIKKDNYLISFLNFFYNLICSFNIKEQKTLKKMNCYRNKSKGEDVFIVLNGPSIKNQDFNLLVGSNVICANRGFKHPLYRQIAPKYHVFIDPKMLNGEWDVNWLDEILEMVPDIIFVMPVSWARSAKFQSYIKKGVSFLWISDKDKLDCLGVSGACFKVSVFLGYKNIYFTGFDGTGLACELINQGESHFYGVNEENLTKTTSDHIRDLYMFSRHLNDLKKYSEKCRKKNINIYNITNGGIINMFNRVSWEEALNKNKK